MGPILKCNLDMHLGISRCEDGTDKARHSATYLIFDEIVGIRCEKIARPTTSGRATKLIEKYLITMMILMVRMIVIKLENHPLET